MSNPFILIARIRVKEGKVEEYLKIAKEADDAVNASEPDMLIHTFDQDPTDPLEFTWSEVYKAIKDTNIPFKHFKTTYVGYTRSNI
jgi:autoinducer 2-degrading protein